MVAQARKLQDAVQRRLPDVRIVFQEGRAWQIDGPPEVCEHRGAMDSGRHWTVTTNFCISGSLLLVTPNHTPSPAPRVEKPEVGTRAHIKPGLNYTRPCAPYGPLTSPCQTQNGKEPESMNNKQHMSETHPTAYANQ